MIKLVIVWDLSAGHTGRHRSGSIVHPPNSADCNRQDQSGESVYIGDDVRLTVLGVRGTQVRIGINAPKEIPVHREEIYYRIKHEQENENEEDHDQDGNFNDSESDDLQSDSDEGDPHNT